MNKYTKIMNKVYNVIILLGVEGNIMNNITYQYIDHTNEKFKEVIDLRFDILFKPYSKISKYEYDEFDDASFHLVALIEEEVIGYSRMTKISDEGKITNVVVSPEYIKRGIGLKMMERHIFKAKENNIGHLYLNARVDTINFYKKIGFECEGNMFLSDKSGLMLQKMCYEIKNDL